MSPSGFVLAFDETSIMLPLSGLSDDNMRIGRSPRRNSCNSSAHWCFISSGEGQINSQQGPFFIDAPGEKQVLISFYLGFMCDWYSCFSSTEFHADAFIENENKCRGRWQSYIICSIPQALNVLNLLKPSHPPTHRFRTRE